MYDLRARICFMRVVIPFLNPSYRRYCRTSSLHWDKCWSRVHREFRCVTSYSRLLSSLSRSFSLSLSLSLLTMALQTTSLVLSFSSYHNASSLNIPISCPCRMINLMLRFASIRSYTHTYVQLIYVLLSHMHSCIQSTVFPVMARAALVSGEAFTKYVPSLLPLVQSKSERCQREVYCISYCYVITYAFFRTFCYD